MGVALEWESLAFGLSAPTKTNARMLYALCSLRFRFVFVGGALCSNLWVRTDFGLACFVAPSILSFARAKPPISMILFLVDSMFNNNKTMKDEMLNATRSTVGLFIFKMENISFFSYLFFYYFLFTHTKS